jgi:uncharacterized membrane protein
VWQGGVPSTNVRPLLPWFIGFLIVLAVIAAAGRAVFVGDEEKRVEPVRGRYLALVGVQEPQPERRARETAWFDRRYAENPVIARLHVIPGALFLIFGALQFSDRFRRRHLRFHRWAGRILIVLALGGVAFSAFYFSFLMPFAGPAETVAFIPFGGFFVIAIVRAFIAIRRRDIETHRAWMTRAYALAVGVSVVRLVALFLDPLLTIYAVAPGMIFVVSVWVGFSATVAATEVWLRRGIGEIGHRRLA